MSTLRETHQSHMVEITGGEFQALSDRLDEIVAQIGSLRDLLTQHPAAPEPTPAAPETTGL